MRRSRAEAVPLNNVNNAELARRAHVRSHDVDGAPMSDSISHQGWSRVCCVLSCCPLRSLPETQRNGSCYMATLEVMFDSICAMPPPLGFCRINSSCCAPNGRLKCDGLPLAWSYIPAMRAFASCALHGFELNPTGQFQGVRMLSGCRQREVSLRFLFHVFGDTSTAGESRTLTKLSVPARPTSL